MAQNGNRAGIASTVIVVEEDASLRRSLQFSLAVEGFAVRTYSRASELLGARDLPADGCIVVDYDLPDMSGLDLLARLRTQNIGLPAILITTNPTGLVRRRAAQAGVPMIEKPLLGDSLVNGIVAALGA